MLYVCVLLKQLGLGHELIGNEIAPLTLHSTNNHCTYLYKLVHTLVKTQRGVRDNILNCT